MVKLTFDGRVMAAKAEIINTINKYELPASVILLICESVENEVGSKMKLTEEGTENGDSKETINGDNTKS